VELLFEIYDEVEAEGIDVNFIVAGNGMAELEAAGRECPMPFSWATIDHNELGQTVRLYRYFYIPIHIGDLW